MWHCRMQTYWHHNFPLLLFSRIKTFWSLIKFSWTRRKLFGAKLLQRAYIAYIKITNSGFTLSGLIFFILHQNMQGSVFQTWFLNHGRCQTPLCPKSLCLCRLCLYNVYQAHHTLTADYIDQNNISDYTFCFIFYFPVAY